MMGRLIKYTFEKCVFRFFFKETDRQRDVLMNVCINSFSSKKDLESVEEFFKDKSYVFALLELHVSF